MVIITGVMSIRMLLIGDGILIAWNKNIIGVHGSRIDSFAMSIKCMVVFDGFVWVISGVYGPNDPCLRERLWEELADVQRC